MTASSLTLDHGSSDRFLDRLVEIDARLPGAKRIPESEAVSLPHIIALPLSWHDAKPLLENMDGPIAPKDWQGGLPIKYRLAGSVTAHLKVEMDNSTQPYYVVEGRIKGSDFPDEWVLLGNHHDAWEYGGVDPSSGTASMMEMTRAFGARLHVLHVTTGDEIPLLAEAKEICTAETTPQHLTLAAPECYERLGTYAQMNPPIRDASHRDALWAAVNQGVIDVIGSDHAPHSRAEKDKVYPDTPSDRRMYDALRGCDWQTWRGYSGAQVEDSGQQEILNWMCLAGAMSELKRKPKETGFVDTWIFNSSKAFLIAPPN